MKELPPIEFVKKWAPDDANASNYDDFQELIRRLQDIEEHEAREVSTIMTRLKRVRYLVDGNYSDLISIIETYEDGPNSVEFDDDDEIYNILMEFTRHFSNYTESIINQRNHTTKILSSLEDVRSGTSIEQDYERKKKKLAIELDGIFFTHIRNMFVHDKTLSASANIHYDSSNMDSAEYNLQIKKSALLEADKTTSKMKAYLEGLDDKINIKTR